MAGLLDADCITIGAFIYCGILVVETHGADSATICRLHSWLVCGGTGGMYLCPVLRRVLTCLYRYLVFAGDTGAGCRGRSAWEMAIEVVKAPGLSDIATAQTRTIFYRST